VLEEMLVGVGNVLVFKKGGCKRYICCECFSEWLCGPTIWLVSCFNLVEVVLILGCNSHAPNS